MARQLFASEVLELTVEDIEKCRYATHRRANQHNTQHRFQSLTKHKVL